MSPICRLCGHEEETPLHLVTECYETIRDARNILGGQGIYPDPYDPQIVFKWGVQKLVQFFALPKLQPLLGESRTSRMTTSSNGRTILLMTKQITKVISQTITT